MKELILFLYLAAYHIFITAAFYNGSINQLNQSAQSISSINLDRLSVKPRGEWNCCDLLVIYSSSAPQVITRLLKTLSNEDWSRIRVKPASTGSKLTVWICKYQTWIWWKWFQWVIHCLYFILLTTPAGGQLFASGMAESKVWVKLSLSAPRNRGTGSWQVQQFITNPEIIESDNWQHHKWFISLLLSS